MNLTDLMQRYVEYKNLGQLEGVISTGIEGVWFYRSSAGNPRQPMLHDSGIIVLGQGHKNVYMQGGMVRYGNGNCLIVGVPMPIECEAFAEAGKPLLGMRIDISLGVLQKQVAKFKYHHYSAPLAPDSSSPSILSSDMEPRMADACRRLVMALCDDMEAAILGTSLVEEIVYHALRCKSGHVLFELADQEGRYARISSVLEMIHQNYSTPLNVGDLASMANMSVSAFHTAFRDVTLESPMQYIKKVRLNKARELIRFEGKRVNDAAHQVGYASASQFSREFKRHFNEAPKSVGQSTI